MRLKEKIIYLSLAFLLMLAFSSSGLSQGKLRIAVVNFENKSTWYYWGERLGEAAADVFVTELMKSEQFSVIEREKLNAVLAEQGLGASGAVTPQTAAQIGKLLGVQYILTGSVTQFSVSDVGGGFRSLGASVTTGKVVLDARLVDTTTGEIVVAEEAENQKRMIGARFRSARFKQSYDYGLAHEVMHPAVAKITEQIMEAASELAPAAGQGMVADVEAGEVIINLGSNQGVKVGDVFYVLRKGKTVIDPATGQPLVTKEKQVGEIVVTEVEATFSTCAIKSGEVKAKDIVRKK